MDFIKVVAKLGGLFQSKKRKKKKALFSVQVELDKATKQKINQMMETLNSVNVVIAQAIAEAKDATKEAAIAIYSDLKESGQLDRLAEKLGALLMNVERPAITITPITEPPPPTRTRGVKVKNAGHGAGSRKNEDNKSSGVSSEATGGDGNPTS